MKRSKKRLRTKTNFTFQTKQGFKSTERGFKNSIDRGQTARSRLSEKTTDLEDKQDVVISETSKQIFCCFTTNYAHNGRGGTPI